MDESRIIDHIVILNDKNPSESVIFNFRTWVTIIKAIMVKYAGKSEDEANSIVLSSPLVNFALNGYMAIVVRAHELDYHWAMLLAHGERYWKRGIDTDEPEGFDAWEEQYRRDHNLEAESFIFID
ncbi:hypothetical protein [Cupriavidus campinensis]